MWDWSNIKEYDHGSFTAYYVMGAELHYLGIINSNASLVSDLEEQILKDHLWDWSRDRIIQTS